MLGRDCSTILIVSESAPKHALNTAFLRQPDIRLITRTQDDAVLDLVAQAPPSLIVEDLQSRTAEGLALCRRLKSGRATRAIPLIVVMEAEHRAEGERAGPDALVIRPVVPDELFNVVGRFVRLPRRKHDRHKTNLRFSYHLDGRHVQAFSRDVFLNGAFIKTDRLVEPGTHMEIEMNIPGRREPLRCGAVVQTAIGDRGYQWNGIWVEFARISDQDLQCLEMYLAQFKRKARFFDRSS
jgi:CheY-like chemotaxis protein